MTKRHQPTHLLTTNHSDVVMQSIEQSHQPYQTQPQSTEQRHFLQAVATALETYTTQYSESVSENTLALASQYESATNETSAAAAQEMLMNDPGFMALFALASQLIQHSGDNNVVADSSESRVESLSTQSRNDASENELASHSVTDAVLPLANEMVLIPSAHINVFGNDTYPVHPYMHDQPAAIQLQAESTENISTAKTIESVLSTETDTANVINTLTTLPSVSPHDENGLMTGLMAQSLVDTTAVHSSLGLHQHNAHSTQNTRHIHEAVEEAIRKVLGNGHVNHTINGEVAQPQQSLFQQQFGLSETFSTPPVEGSLFPLLTQGGLVPTISDLLVSAICGINGESAPSVSCTKDVDSGIVNSDTTEILYFIYLLASSIASLQATHPDETNPVSEIDQRSDTLFDQESSLTTLNKTAHVQSHANALNQKSSILESHTQHSMSDPLASILHHPSSQSALFSTSIKHMGTHHVPFRRKRLAILSRLLSLTRIAAKAPLACEFPGCKQSFYTKGTLKTHMGTHDQKNKVTFQCSYFGCNKLYRWRSALDAHILTHNGKSMQADMQADMRIDEIGDINMRDDTVDRTDDSGLARFTGTLDTIMASPRNAIACEHEGCKQICANRNAMEMHQRTHFGVRSYICPIKECGQAFAQHSALRSHSFTHSGERPYKCKYEGCESAFTTSSRLIVHIRIHTQENPYVCSANNCKKQFKQASSLKRHLETHWEQLGLCRPLPRVNKKPENKEYICSECLKRYSSRQSLSRHRIGTHLTKGSEA